MLSCLKNTHANVIKPLEVFKSEDISEDTTFAFVSISVDTTFAFVSVSVDTTFAFVSVSVENVKQILLDNDLAVSS